MIVRIGVISQRGAGTVFADPAGVAAYREAIERADAFFCVSRHLRNQVADAVGAKAAEKIEIVPNIVDLTDIPYVTRATLVFRR